MADNGTKPTVRPLYEGYVRKGGQNRSTSQIAERPKPPPRLTTGSGQTSGPTAEGRK